MTREPLYRIDGWSRRNDLDLGSCVFTIHLDPDFAKKARDFRFGVENQLIFENRLRKSIGYPYLRATFLEETAFLRSMSVEGNCACLGVSGTILDSNWDERTRIEYNGHNIDSKQQAFDLLSIFIEWVDLVEALTWK